MFPGTQSWERVGQYRIHVSLKRDFCPLHGPKVTKERGKGRRTIGRVRLVNPVSISTGIKLKKNQK